MPPLSLAPTIPGIFITATDTEVGKTVITSAIAAVLKRMGVNVGVCKPMASDCRKERGQLINADAEALAYFSQTDQPLDIVNPIRFKDPLAPAPILEKRGELVDTKEIAYAMQTLSKSHDVLLIEGIGGWLAPLDENDTVEDLALAFGYPTIVVTRQNLGTLNHTALTCRSIRQSGLPLQGLVINRFDNDSPDMSVHTNPHWLMKQNKLPILAHVPDAPDIDMAKGIMPADILEAVAMTDWLKLCKMPQAPQNY